MFGVEDDYGAVAQMSNEQKVPARIQACISNRVVLPPRDTSATFCKGRAGVAAATAVEAMDAARRADTARRDPELEAREYKVTRVR